MDYAGLEKDVVLVSAVNKIEIWDKTKYNSSLNHFHRKLLVTWQMK